jgi:hypothetical protein
VKTPLKDTKQVAQAPATYTVTFSESLKIYLRTHGTSGGSDASVSAEGSEGSEAGRRIGTGSYDSCTALDELLGAFKHATTA